MSRSCGAAFTLIELMIVVAIIAVIAALIIPNLTTYDPDTSWVVP